MKNTALFSKVLLTKTLSQCGRKAKRREKDALSNGKHRFFPLEFFKLPANGIVCSLYDAKSYQWREKIKFFFKFAVCFCNLMFLTVFQKSVKSLHTMLPCRICKTLRLLHFQFFGGRRIFVESCCWELLDG